MKNFRNTNVQLTTKVSAAVFYHAEMESEASRFWPPGRRMYRFFNLNFEQNSDTKWYFYNSPIRPFYPLRHILIHSTEVPNTPGTSNSIITTQTPFDLMAPAQAKTV